jgi:hypothetical protein
MQNINEELKRMLYLTKHMRGVVISEQNNSGQLTGSRKTDNSKNYFTDAPDWGGTSSGNLDMSGLGKVGGVIVNAKNVKYKDRDDLVVSINSSIGKELEKNITLTKTTPPSKKPPLRTRFTFEDSTFPYPNNMIKPYFEYYPESKKLYDVCVETMKNNIIEYGMDSLKEIIFKGSADSAAPTDAVDVDFKNIFKELDHTTASSIESEFTTPSKCSKNYCGISRKNLSERNQFLADRRAGVMAKIFLNDVANAVNSANKETAKDVRNVSVIYDKLLQKIKIVKGDNYYDGQPGRRGIRGVSIDVIPNKDKITPGTETPGSEETMIVRVAPRVIRGTFNIGGKAVKYIQSANEKGYFVIKILNDENAKSLLGNYIPDMSVTGQLNGKSQVKGSIKGDNMIVDNLNWGGFMENPDRSNYANLYITENEILCAVSVGESEINLRYFKVTLGDPEYLIKK